MKTLYDIQRDAYTSKQLGVLVDTEMDKAVSAFRIETLLGLVNHHFLRSRRPNTAHVFALTPKQIENTTTYRYGLIRFPEGNRVVLDVFDGRPDPKDPEVAFQVDNGARGTYYITFDLNEADGIVRIKHDIPVNNINLTEQEISQIMIEALRSVMMVQLGSEVSELRGV